MKTLLRFSLIAASLTVAGAASATDAPTPYAFETVAGQHFVRDFLITLTTSNSFVVGVTANGAQYSDLNFEILGSPLPQVVGKVFGATTTTPGTWIASFNDPKNNSYVLLSGTQYTLRISGDTTSSIVGGVGAVSVLTAGGSITPVPEPESYAMLLAGLGLMGTIARRRSKTAQA